jgi:hypothetical protein
VPPGIPAALAPALRVVGRVDFGTLADAVGVADAAASDAREDWLSAAAIPAPASEAHTPTLRAPTPSNAYGRKPRVWPGPTIFVYISPVVEMTVTRLSGRTGSAPASLEDRQSHADPNGHCS